MLRCLTRHALFFFYVCQATCIAMLTCASAVTWQSSTGKVVLYDNARPVWTVTRGKGKVIPPGGTLVIGREQVRAPLRSMYVRALLKHSVERDMAQGAQACLSCSIVGTSQSGTHLCAREITVRSDMFQIDCCRCCLTACHVPWAYIAQRRSAGCCAQCKLVLRLPLPLAPGPGCLRVCACCVCWLLVAAYGSTYGSTQYADTPFSFTSRLYACTFVCCLCLTGLHGRLL